MSVDLGSDIIAMEWPFPHTIYCNINSWLCLFSLKKELITSDRCVEMGIPWQLCRTIGPLLGQRLPLAIAKAHSQGEINFSAHLSAIMYARGIFLTLSKMLITVDTSYALLLVLGTQIYSLCMKMHQRRCTCHMMHFIVPSPNWHHPVMLWRHAVMSHDVTP